MLKSLALAGALALALTFPAMAQECTNNYDDVHTRLLGAEDVKSGAVAVVEVQPGKLPDFLAALSESLGADVTAATRAFVIVGPNGVVVGLEMDGCLLDPIRVEVALPTTHKSGRMADGKTYA